MLGATAQDVLDSLDGVAYVVGPDGTILGVGRPNWAAAIEAGRAADRLRDVMGTNLFDWISGRKVQGSYQMMMASILDGSQPSVVVPYRCDTPAGRRQMRLSLTPYRAAGRISAVLYQSVLLAETMRPPVNLFDPDILVANLSDTRGRPLVTMCSYCQRIAWPPGQARRPRSWIEAEDYYRRGGASDIRISHGICPPCYKGVVGPLAAKNMKAEEAD
ncbi:MAG: hypothetical protein AB7K86_19650 [Rhodospirillales bacterium]